MRSTTHLWTPSRSFDSTPRLAIRCFIPRWRQAFRAFALKLASAALDHSRTQWLRLAPQHLKPAWAATLIEG